jgi:hypothetical protein
LLNNIYQRVRYPSDQQRDVDLIASADPYQVYLVVLKVQQQTARSLELISALVEDLPDEQVRQKLVQELELRLDDLQDRLTALEDLIGQESGMTNAVRSVPANALPTLQTIHHDTSTLSSEVRALEDLVRKEAEEKKRSAEFRYRIWSFLSYGLYALGWTLGLIGEIYGVKVGAGEQ